MCAQCKRYFPLAFGRAFAQYAAMAKQERIFLRIDAADKAAAEAIAEARDTTISKMLRDYLLRTVKAAAKDAGK